VARPLKLILQATLHICPNFRLHCAPAVSNVT